MGRDVQRARGITEDSNTRFVLHTCDNSAAPPLQHGVLMPSYIVMRRGESMQMWIQKRTPNPTRAMWMLNEVCSQLAAMHQAGFVHRDIKR
jgi:tRNA A-37 threonylcarbamoyl transferase component Bud32